MKRYLGVILIIISAVGYGLMPNLARFAYGFGMGVDTLLLIRFTTASALLFLYMLLRKQSLRLTLSDIGALILLGGVCFTLQSTLYFSSVRLIPVSLAVLVFYTYPLFVTIMTGIIHRKLPDRLSVLSMLFSFSGLILIGGTIPRSINITGVLLSIASAVVYSAYVVYGNHVVKKLDSVVITAFVTLFAALGVLLLGIYSDSIKFNFYAGALPYAFGIALFCTVLTILTFFKGLELLGASKASILSMLEPLFAVLFAIILLGESLPWTQAAGGIVILAGAVLVSLSAVSKEKEGTRPKDS